MASKQQVSLFKKRRKFRAALSQDKLTLYYHIQNFARVD